MRQMNALIATLLVGCASAPEPEGSLPPAGLRSPEPEGPGPMRPLGPDRELDAAEPIDVENQPLMEAWLAERVAAAKDGVRERVRLPLVRRSAAFGCDCPPFAVGRYTDNGPFFWVRVMDMTSAGMPHEVHVPSDAGVMLWVDGRFTGGVDSYRSTDDGGRDVATPVFEILRVSRRTGDEEAVARAVRER